MAAHKKRSSYSWDRSGLRQIQFKALKKGEKIGFGLGGDGQRLEIVSVKEGTQAYWKGVNKGYKVVSVNNVKVDAITVKAAIKGACTSGGNFTVCMATGKPMQADDEKKVSIAKPKRVIKRGSKWGVKANKKRPVVDDSKEEIVVQGYQDEKPIIDKGDFFYQDEVDAGGWFAGDEQADEYIPVEKILN